MPTPLFPTLARTIVPQLFVVRSGKNLKKRLFVVLHLTDRVRRALLGSRIRVIIAVLVKFVLNVSSLWWVTVFRVVSLEL